MKFVDANDFVKLLDSMNIEHFSAYYRLPDEREACLCVYVKEDLGAFISRIFQGILDCKVDDLVAILGDAKSAFEGMECDKGKDGYYLYFTSLKLVKENNDAISNAKF